MQQILRMWPLNAIAFFTLKSIIVSRSHIEMRSFQFIVLFVMVDNVGDGSLFIEASLVDGVFC